MLIYQLKISMVSRNNRKEPLLTLNFANQRQEYFYALMLPKEVLIFLQLIGLFNSILLMIQKIIFTELVELLEGLMVRVEHFSSY
jgi:hypothetical protein